MRRSQGKRQTGFSLIELMVTLVIGGILISTALFMLSESVTNARLRSATEAMYADLLYAQTHATSVSRNVYVKISSGANWCYGLSITSGCDCSASSCVINSQLRTNTATDYPNVSLATSNFSNELLFESTRGNVSSGITTSPASFTFTADGDSSIVQVNDSGVVSYCSDDLAGYPSC